MNRFAVINTTINTPGNIGRILCVHSDESRANADAEKLSGMTIGGVKQTAMVAKTDHRAKSGGQMFSSWIVD